MEGQIGMGVQALEVVMRHAVRGARGELESGPGVYMEKRWRDKSGKIIGRCCRMVAYDHHNSTT